jgi:predicted nucleotidyltransferase
MLSESSPSVKVTWFDYTAVWAEVNRFAQELLQQFSEVEEVRVFGSLVRRECVPGSDVDLLVVLRESSLPFHHRISRYLPRRPMPVAVDVFPYTRRELEQMLAEDNHFLRRAMQESVLLARREHNQPVRETPQESETR